MTTIQRATKTESGQPVVTRRRFLAEAALGVGGVAVMAAWPGRGRAADQGPAVTRGTMETRSPAIHEAIQAANAELWRRFVDPRWHTIYNHADLDGTVVLPTAEECLADKPNALSWDISISDEAMLGGLYMAAALHRWTITRQAEDRQKASRIADGLMKLATVGNTKGFIARGLTADGSAHYALSSNDQTLPWLYGMWRYLRSDIPDEVQRQKVTAEIIEGTQSKRRSGRGKPSPGPPVQQRRSADIPRRLARDQHAVAAAEIRQRNPGPGQETARTARFALTPAALRSAADARTAVRRLGGHALSRSGRPPAARPGDPGRDHPLPLGPSLSLPVLRGGIGLVSLEIERRGLAWAMRGVRLTLLNSGPCRGVGTNSP